MPVEQKTNRAHSAIQVGGDVNGNVYLVTPEPPPPKGRTGHFASQESSVSEVKAVYNQLTWAEKRDVIKFCSVQFDTKMYRDLPGDKLFRVKRLCESMLAKRIGNAPKTAPHPTAMTSKRQMSNKHLLLSALSIFFVLVGMVLIKKHM